MSESIRVIRDETVLRCAGGDFSNRGRGAWSAGKVCGAKLGPTLPFRCLPTGRVWHRYSLDRPTAVPGRIEALCRKCGMVTEYRVVQVGEPEGRAA